MNETLFRTSIRNLIWYIFGVILLIVITYIGGKDIWLAIEVALAYNIIRFLVRIPYDQICFKIWAIIDLRGMIKRGELSSLKEKENDCNH